jgi:hypothetical protein
MQARVIIEESAEARFSWRLAASATVIADLQKKGG